MPTCLEKQVPLNGEPSVAAVRPTAFQRHQLTLDQCFYIGAIQLACFGAVVDQEQNGKFMRAQHSHLRFVSFGGHVTIARDGGSAQWRHQSRGLSRVSAVLRLPGRKE